MPKALLLSLLLVGPAIAGCATPRQDGPASEPAPVAGGCHAEDPANLGSSNGTHGSEVNEDGTWPTPPEPTAILSSPDARPGDRLGWSIALDDGTLLAAAPETDRTGERPGEVHVYERGDDGEWCWQAELRASDGAGGDGFGWRVALEGDTAAIAATGHNGSRPFSGAVYVFERGPDGWSERAKLVPSGFKRPAFAGERVSLDGDRIALSAPGHQPRGVFVFERGEEGWTETANLGPPDGWPGRFGTGLALDGSRLVASGQNDPDGLIAGSAVLFERATNGSWEPHQRVLPPGERVGSRMGWALELENGTLALGDRAGVGSVKVFEKAANGTFTHDQTLAVDTPFDSGSSFGYAIDLQGDHLAVGDTDAGPWGTGSGSAYLYERGPGDRFEEVSRLSAPNGTAWQGYGTGVALDGGVLAVGAPGPGNDGNATGAVYVYDALAR